MNEREVLVKTAVVSKVEIKYCGCLVATYTKGQMR